MKTIITERSGRPQDIRKRKQILDLLVNLICGVKKGSKSEVKFEVAIRSPRAEVK